MHVPPLASVIPMLAYITAVIVPVYKYKLPAVPTSWLATALLASPFAVFFVAAVLMPNRPKALPVFGALCIASVIPWQLCTVLMAWFKPGFGGAVVLGALMAIGASIFVLIYHRSTRGRRVAP